MDFKRKKIISNTLKLLFLIASAVMFIVFYDKIKNISVEGVINYINEKLPFGLGIFMILGLYFLKGLIFVMPLLIIYAVAGAIYGPLVAILVGSAGLIIELSTTFFVGKWLGMERIEKLAVKHEKIGKVLKVARNNNFIVLLLRMAGIFPAEPVSIVCGAVGYRYIPYIVNSYIGMLPGLIFFSIMGNAITDPLSVQFILPFICSIALSFIAFFIYQKKNKKE